MNKKEIISLMNRFRVLHLVEKRYRRRLRILMYHRFSETEHPLRISAESFERQLCYLKANAQVISIDEAVQHLRDGKKLPDFATVITIDDGYRDSYTIAYPLLKKYDLPATMYAVSSFLQGEIWLWTDKARFILENTSLQNCETSVGGKAFSFDLTDANERLEAAMKLNEALKQQPNDVKEIELENIARDLSVEVPKTPPTDYSGFSAKQAIEMAENGITIGSHTVTHPLMDKIGPEEQLREASESKRRLEELLNREIEHFCYPNGAFDDLALESVRRSGYLSAVSSDFGACGIRDDRFSLKRVPAESEMLSFLQNFTGFEELKRNVRSRLRSRKS